VVWPAFHGKRVLQDVTSDAGERKNTKCGNEELKDSGGARRAKSAMARRVGLESTFVVA